MSFPVTINGNTYTAAEFLNYGHLTEFPAIIADVATVGTQVVDAAATSTTNANATAADVVLTNADVVLTNADVVTANASVVAAELAQTAAEAAVVGAQLPVASTTGTSTAYEFTNSDLTIGDSVAIRVNFDKTCGVAPTLEETTNGNPYEIVDRGNRSLTSGEISSGQSYILLYDTAINKWIVQNLPLVKLISTLDGNSQTVNNIRLTNTPVTYPQNGSLAGKIIEGDYVIGYIDYDSTLSGGSYDPDEGSATIELYLSANKTSASGVAVTGGSFSVSAGTPDSNTFTGNNTVASGSPRYVVAKVTSATTLKNAKGSIMLTKNSEDI